ncbi:MAG: beta-ketoacyl synthase, partial [Bacteroidales bacterium]|nr:beta-ketoacyl synthase [Bacteroidales bacterium]
MRKVICIGSHILSPLGDGVAENFSAVLEGKSALKLHEGTFGVPEPFVASLLERPETEGPLFNALIVDSARKAAEAAGIDPSDRRCGIVL